MEEIIGVRFNSTGKAYYFDPCGLRLSIGTMVVVETARGVEIGKVSIPNRKVPSDDVKAPLKKIVRVATEKDKAQLRENEVREKDAFKKANELIRLHNPEMKLIDVEYTFDRSKILFYFTADGRVDFRELVKALAAEFKTRIELRQIGVRDEARQLGSIGICGRFLCCSTFLDDFRPVSIKMAKEQGLSLNPTKISGVCGRLMCCLQYEEAAYEDALKTMPQKGAAVETINGTGVVVDTNTLKQEIRVRPDDAEGHKMETYKVGEFNVVGKPATVSLDEVRKKKEEEKEPELVINDTPIEYKTEEPAQKPPRRKNRGSSKRSASQKGEKSEKSEKNAKSEANSTPKSGEDGGAVKKKKSPRRRNRKKPSNGGYSNQQG